MSALAGLPRAPADRAARHRADGLWDNRLLADGVEAGADRRPDVVAVVDNDRGLSYAQLATAVAAGVTALAARGVRAGDGVVLVSGNTRHGVIAYHALLRAGATTILLDRRCGVADLRVALDALSARPRVIVPAAEAERLAEPLAEAAEVVPLELFDEVSGPPGEPSGSAEPSEPSEPSGSAGSRPPSPWARAWAEPDRDRAAVVLFTSGTTSRPKGLVHSLNTLTAGADNMAWTTSADESTVVFLVSPLTSITGLSQIHLAADRHATLALEDRFEPERTLRQMNAVGATLLGGAPVIAERLLRAAVAAGPDGAGIGLRTLALGGAMLPRPLLELATDTFGIEIARVYGSSEAPTFSGSLPGDDRERRLSDDGALLPGSEVRVGSSQHPREGLLRGPNLFLGYLDAADNEAAFEDGWFRTGDQLELHDGRLTVVGRLKEVVNRNGLKISLTEIDAALADLPGAVEAASFGMPDPSTGERLAVAVWPDGGAAVTLAALVAHLVARGTATRKLPEQLVRWDAPLPRTASGKVVRSRLVIETPGRDSDLAARLTGG
ncbi:class I adenylate-forming enzyme family protein [Pseudofrankia sp. BMG5.36]|uniref:class I adenylate-forming enzyme family protein n=1 Tax=Pseudofrankia sp. BMG5.36 TaxID=1834512 RepID=UPI0008D983B7|nr:class I adenylate-forming enzyme family protein [Pseudofrankia sp. BMG5.36]OHV58964.1 AMP-dependent synthetase [Pseudofrankia sp. BMG5.36]